MSPKEIVQAGLDRRRMEQHKREAALEGQARQLRLTINDNHAARTMTDVQRLAAEKAERMAKAKARRDKENASIAAVHMYVKVCLAIFLTTLLTPFPWWAAIALVAGTAVFPVIRIYRLEVGV